MSSNTFSNSNGNNDKHSASHGSDPIKYQQMVDETSKHLEQHHSTEYNPDIDLSNNYDYADTHHHMHQDTNRNLRGVHNVHDESDIGLGQSRMELRDGGALCLDDLTTTSPGGSNSQTVDLIAAAHNKQEVLVSSKLKQAGSKELAKYKLAKGFSQDYEEQKVPHKNNVQVFENEGEEDARNVSKSYQHFNTEGGGYNDEYEDIDGAPQTIGKQKPKQFAGYQLKPQLPQMKVNIPLALSGNDVFEIFTSICKQQKFQVIEMDQNIATAVNKEPFSLKKIFQRCIPTFSSDAKRQMNEQVHSESQISAVRLSISVNEVKVCRKIALKGLYGDSHKLQEFLTNFKNKLHEAVTQLPPSQRNESMPTQGNATVVGGTNITGVTPRGQLNQIGHKKNANSRTQMSSKNGARRVASDDDSDQEESQQYNETSSIYQIHKILSSDQYTLGKNVAQYIECFHLQYKSLRESAALLPQPMEGMMSLIQETVSSFNSEYNLGKQHARSLMTHCRPSVEKYIFSKLYDKLFAMYAIKNEEEDHLFVERSSLIKRMPAHDIMIYLGIRKQFILGENTAHTVKFEDHLKDLTGNQTNLSQYDSHRSDNNLSSHQIRNDIGQDNLSNNEQVFNQTSSSTAANRNDIGGLYSQGLTGAGPLTSRCELPYAEAIKSLEKMQQYQSPREKLACINQSFSHLKTTIVDHWKGKLELNAMDDVLPLTIYVVAMADLSHPQSEFNIMEDYLQLYDKGFEFEKKLLTNFDVSIRYVNHEWEIPNTLQ